MPLPVDWCRKRDSAVLFVSRSVCSIRVCPSVCISVCVSVSVCLSALLSVSLTLCLSVCLSVWLAGWLAGCVSLSLCAYTYRLLVCRVLLVSGAHTTPTATLTERSPATSVYLCSTCAVLCWVILAFDFRRRNKRVKHPVPLQNP